MTASVVRGVLLLLVVAQFLGTVAVYYLGVTRHITLSQFTFGLPLLVGFLLQIFIMISSRFLPTPPRRDESSPISCVRRGAFSHRLRRCNDCLVEPVGLVIMECNER
jgi:hypothetical protein